MPHQILITENIDSQWIEKLKTRFTVRFEHDFWQAPEKLKAILPAFDALIVRNQTPVSTDVIAAGSQLQVIGREGSGLDNINVEEATAAGIVVANAPDQNTISVAELTLGLMLALARKIPAADGHVRMGKWKRKQFTGSELYNKTLGIVGLGRTGFLTAVRGRAFGMNILAHDPYITPDKAVVTHTHAKLIELNELLPQADFVSCHVPLTDETKHMFGYNQFCRMKPSAFFLNMARGKIVNERGLIQALKEEKIVGAALDVFEQEPPKESPLFEMENVILTPHVAGVTHEAQKRVAAAACEDVSRVLEGEAAINYVNFPKPKAVLTSK
jgi:D-3-phosphoglycerate dehydrogenase